MDLLSTNYLLTEEKTTADIKRIFHLFHTNFQLNEYRLLYEINLLKTMITNNHKENLEDVIK